MAVVRHGIVSWSSLIPTQLPTSAVRIEHFEEPSCVEVSEHLAQSHELRNEGHVVLFAVLLRYWPRVLVGCQWFEDGVV